MGLKGWRRRPIPSRFGSGPGGPSWPTRCRWPSFRVGSTDCLRLRRCKRGGADKKRVAMARFHVGDSAFSVARRFCDGGRRNGPRLLAEGRTKSTSTNKSTSTSTSTSRSRSGAVKRLSVGGRRDGPPWPPFLRGEAPLRSRSTFGPRFSSCRTRSGRSEPAHVLPLDSERDLWHAGRLPSTPAGVRSSAQR